MRTLPAPLLTAQQAASTEPHVDVVVENIVGAVRRLDFARIDNTSHMIAKHDCAVAADGSVTRVRMESGAVKQQRVTNPTLGPWNAWNNLATGMGAHVACAAKGARVAVVYVDSAGTGIKLRESTDSGATFAAEVAVTTAGAAVTDIAVALKNSSGDLAIAWGAGTLLAIIKRALGVFSAVSTTSPGLSSTNGVAMTYGFDWDIVVTGVEAATLRPSLWTLVHGDGNDAPANTWTALQLQQQAEADAQITFKAPSIVFTDTYRITFTAADAFTGGATRTWRTWLHPAATFVSGAYAVRTPVPADYGGSEGLALAADAGGAGYVYESAPDAVYRAAQSPLTVTLTADVLAIYIDEQPYATRGYIELDNTDGLYGGAVPAIAAGNRLAVSWGYRTSVGPQASRMADLWIAAVEHRRKGGVSTVRLYVEGGWELLRRNTQRTQIVHSGGETYAAIVARIFARAGLLLAASAVSARAASVTPQFTVAPGVSGLEAARTVLSMLADRIRMGPLASAVITEPLASPSSQYTFGVAHPLRDLRAVTASPVVTEVQVFGAAAYGEAFDLVGAGAGLGLRRQRRDLSSTSGSAAAASATAHLRQLALDADAGRIVAAPHCGLELLDVIDFADVLVQPAAIKRRVRGIAWRFDRIAGVYEQEIALGAL